MRANGSRPLRLCLTCHKELHESPEKQQSPQQQPATGGSARQKKSTSGAHPTVASPTAAAVHAAHVVQHTLPELCDFDERLHPYLPDAIVRSSFPLINLSSCSYLQMFSLRCMMHYK